MKIQTEKGFQRLWWLVFTINLALACAVGYAVVHFIRKYW